MITRGIQLSHKIINHIENASNLVIYKLGEHHIPSNIFFPKAHDITLINCSRIGVFNILTTYILPNLQRVNYLSAHPGNFDIYKRFHHNPKKDNYVQWVFPNKDYDFYTYILNKNIGMKDNQLINRYLKNKRIIDGVNGFDVSFQFDIDLPEYGDVEGEWYRNQFYEYCVSKQNEIIQESEKELF